jgi:hypothetical protein
LTRFGFSVEKQTLFRGVQQPFANIYYYDVPGLGPEDTSGIESILDHLVTNEKAIHGSNVTFIRGRAWNTGSGSPGGNQMRVDKNLSGVGSGNPAANMDKERAILIRVPAGTNSRGKPVYLRKWYHTCAQPGVSAFTAGQLENTAQLAANQRDSFANFFNQLLDFSDVATAGADTFGVASLVSQTGRQTTGTSECHPYLEHHQLGDQWR